MEDWLGPMIGAFLIDAGYPGEAGASGLKLKQTENKSTNTSESDLK